MKWERVNKANPCPVCGHDHWCSYNSEVILCMWTESKKPIVIRSGEVGYIHPANGHKLPPPKLRDDKPKEPVINVGKLLEGWRRADKVGALEQLAQDLSVDVNALKRLRCVWAQEHRAWAFPMRDGYGNYVGIRLRSQEGRKWAVRGSHQGMFYSPTDFGRTVLLAEGPTDTAACMSLGYFAIGRPSCSGGMADVRVACRRLSVERAVILADNDGPGVAGAMMLAKHLPIPCAALVLPAKDVREFIQLGGTRDLLDSMIEQSIWNQPPK